MNKQHFHRLLSLVIVIVMCLGMVVPAGAAPAPAKDGWIIEKVDNSAVSVKPNGRVEAPELDDNTPDYKDTDVVRVSVVLEEKSTLEMAVEEGISTQGIAGNDVAMTYRAKLVDRQADMVQRISNRALGGEALDVVWNLTLAANIISANVQYGQIEKIANVPGVAKVVIETRYEPDVVEVGGDNPDMATSSEQIGSTVAYASGYTGAGSRIAIIDTGTDTAHLSFQNDAFLYSLEQNAIAAGMEYEDYIASLDLLDAEEIASVFSKLNIAPYAAYGLTPALLYGNEKLAFNFNYVDGSLRVTHVGDTQGEHGSHVAGIATANRYVSDGEGGFVKALDSVFVQGVAPDAQLITMKVFGSNGGAYDSDYMAAIEDAIILGADAINLSLGSAAPGMTYSDEYQDVMDMLSTTDTVVVMSAGNSGGWADATYYGQAGYPYLFAEDVSYHTGGSPGTFTNSLGVASVENAGYIANLIEVDGIKVNYYENTEYGNKAMGTLTGEQEFVFVNGIGTPEDFAAVDVEGKVAICYRGETSFFEKANAAVEAGAIGVIIVNNQAGIIGLNLTGYLFTAPVVSMTQEEGEFFKGNPVNDEEGNALYWTGKLSVAGTIPLYYDSDYYTMSAFSAWGVPGDLSMKPEITAPGGNIYSVMGAYYDSQNGVYVGATSDRYEVMSGTSMAAPQVTGMMAVVMQYIRENDLSVDGLTDRALAQSLLMSTAKPIMDGNSGSYYPVLQQGAGLANVGAAVNAKSYILMDANANDSAADGKVKVELGDDPAKTGEYAFSFTVNNMTGEDVEYVLTADFFTQDLWAIFLDQWTTGLEADVTWLVEGTELETNEADANMDFNGDGAVNTDDAVAILDYITGNLNYITNEYYADFDGNGAVTSRDAYLFLALLEGSAVTVPAYESVSVTVMVELTDEKLANYVNGAYVEGYVYVSALPSDEGVEGETHSIPVLGFYGNWTDPSMYDITGEYLSFEHGYETFYLTMKDADNGKEYIYGGNPFIADEEYMPERDAISVANGDVLNSLAFTSIRNAGNAMLLVYDAYGNIYVASELGPVQGAYYNVNGEYWNNVVQALNVSTLPLERMPEDVPMYISLLLAPELYAEADGSYDWGTLLDTLGNGAWLDLPFAIDNTEPELTGADVYTINEDTMTMTVSVQDNQYVAGIALFDKTGEYVYAYEGSKVDVAAGEEVVYELDLSEVNGAEFLLQVYDYAGNTTTYRITRTIGTVTEEITGVTMSQESVTMMKGSSVQLTAFVEPVNAVNRDVIWYSVDPTVATVDENGVVTAVGKGSTIIAAFAAGNTDIYGACEVSVIDPAVDLTGIVWDDEGIWISEFNTSTLPEYTTVGQDLAYIDFFNSAVVTLDGAMYAGSFDPRNGQGAIYKFDVYSVGADTEFRTVKLSDSIIQGTHIFYSDMAIAPNLGNGMILGTYFPYVMAIDAATGQSMSIVYEYSNDIVAIAYAGSVYNTYYGRYVDTFYLLDAAGNLYYEGFIDMGGAIYYFNGEDEGFVGNTGIKASKSYYQSMTYVDGYLYVSNLASTADGIVKIYVIDENSGAVSKLGEFEEGVWPVGGLMASLGLTTATSDNADALAQMQVKGTAEDVEMKAVYTGTAAGSLNSVANYAPVVNPRSSAEAEEDQSTVVLEVTAKAENGNDVFSNNGVYEIYYNAENLTIDSIQVHADYESIYVDEESGYVAIAYVSMAGIPAGSSIATLTFTVDNVADHAFVIETYETNDAIFDVVEEVELTHKHVYGEWYVYEETSFIAAGEERRDCIHCDHYESRLIPVLPAPVTPAIPGPTMPGVPSEPSVDPVDPVDPEQPGEPLVFTDVKEDAWYAEAVDYVTANGIMIGTSEDEFSPEEIATRAMVWTMLARLNGVEVTGESKPWYAEALAWVTENGVSDGTMANNGITREQVYTMLWRAYGSPEVEGDLSAFVDVDQISDWAVDAIEWAVSIGIMNGMGNDDLNPKGETTRAMLAQIFANMDGKF